MLLRTATNQTSVDLLNLAGVAVNMADVVYHTRSRVSTASTMQRQVLQAAVHRAYKDCRDDDS